MNNQALDTALFELYCWKFSNTGCFTNRLFDLIQKADSNNRLLLYMAFPSEVAVFLEWEEKGSEWLREIIAGKKGEPQK